jgi:hypothetical protein
LLIPGLLTLAAAVWLLTWGAVFPAVMTPDSIDQWGQALHGRYTDWHPVAHTLLVKAAQNVWPSPGSLVLLNLVIMTAIVGAGLRLLWSTLGASGWIVTAAGLFFALHPVHAAMLTTLWKDIPYALALTAFSLGLLRWFHAPGRRLTASGWLLLGGSAMAVAVLRHGGLLCAAAGFTALIGTRPPQWRSAVLCLLVVTVASIGWQTWVHRGLKAPAGPVTEKLAIPLQQAAAVVAADGRMTPGQRARLAAVLPIETWRSRYDRYTVDPLKFDPGFRAEPIAANAGSYVETWLGLIAQNPVVAFNAWQRQTLVLWYPGVDARSTYPEGISENFYNLTPAPRSARLQAAIRRLHAAAQTAPWSWTTRPAVFHLVLLASAIVCLRHRGPAAWVPYAPWAAGVAIYFFALPTPDFRYFYPGLMLAPFLLAHAWLCARSKPPAPASSA